MKNKCNIKRSFLREKFEKERKLLELQKKYEEGIIKETELSEEEKRSLMELYKSQIEDLQKDIDGYKRTSLMYKEKILEIQKKL